jgi:hypothetical protein
MSAPPVTDAAALREYFAAQEARTLQPWRATREQFRREVAAYAKIGKTERIDMFVDMAKSAMLSADEVLTATYTLFGSEDDLAFYSTILLRRRGRDRIASHNWYVAEQLGEAFIDQHGSVLSTLAHPLFPADHGCQVLNIRLLYEAARQPVGAGAGQRRSTLFRDDDDVTGAGYLPVQPAGDGQGWVVDVGGIEAAFTQLQQAQQQVQQQVLQSIRTAAARPQQPRQRSAPTAQQHQQQWQPQQQQQQQWQSRGQQRGRGRDSGPRGGDGATESPAASQPPPRGF